jgi:hypothetical protein
MLPGAQQANLQRQCGQERPDKQPLGASLAQVKAVQHRHSRLGASPRRKVACDTFMAEDNGNPPSMVVVTGSRCVMDRPSHQVAGSRLLARARSPDNSRCPTKAIATDRTTHASTCPVKVPNWVPHRCGLQSPEHRALTVPV